MSEQEQEPVAAPQSDHDVLVEIRDLLAAILQELRKP